MVRINNNNYLRDRTILSLGLVSCVGCVTQTHAAVSAEQWQRRPAWCWTRTRAEIKQATGVLNLETRWNDTSSEHQHWITAQVWRVHRLRSGGAQEGGESGSGAQPPRGGYKSPTPRLRLKSGSCRVPTEREGIKLLNAINNAWRLRVFTHFLQTPPDG